jgi:UPF0755 protein
MTRRGRIIVGLSVLLAIFAVPALAGYIYLRSIGFMGNSDPGRPVAFVIPKGASIDEIGRVLESKGVIRSAFGFRLATYFDEGAEDIQAGRYKLTRGLTARDALQALLGKGPLAEKFITVTFLEGYWLEDFAATLAKNSDIRAREFMDLATSGDIRSRYQPKNVDTLEGLLFPSTYQLGVKEDARQVVTKLVEEFEKQAASAGLSGGLRRRAQITPYEAVIVASMIEAETRVDSERPKVARVIYNRLNEGMLLGIDATVLYALGEHKETLTASDLEIDSPYNTRKFPGLPPTPIGAPGLAALKAAVNPADGEWLYYVLADCEGNHAFSESYEEFLQNKNEYQELEC